MKKSIFKTITAFMLFAITLGLTLLNGCQKNVGDVYEYEPVVLAPDFEIVEVVHAFDNDELNSDSWLSFKVVYANNEVTETTYPSVLNFYVNGEIEESAALEEIAGNTNYENVFQYKAKAGQHTFKFEINLSSDGNTMVVEQNTANNTQETNLNIAVKKLAVVQEVVVEAVVVDEAIAADETADVASVLANENITVSTTVEAVETTYDDNTTAIVAAVENLDGSIDSTKVVMSVTSNAGVNEGEAQEATSVMIVETLVDKKEVSFYNANEKLTYTDGVVSFTALKSAQAGCTEPSNMALFFQNPTAVQVYIAAIAGVIATDGIEAALRNAPQLLITTLNGFGYTQGNIDNPPTYTVEILNANAICSENCVNGYKEEAYAYPGFKLTFTDDRDAIAPIVKQPGCSNSNAGTYSATDCGGNSVSYIFSKNTRAIVRTQTRCASGNHN